jgi:predicted MFS family arabinose efflux permease
VVEGVPLRRNRDFTLLWSSHAVSLVGSQISAIALPLLVLALTGSAADAGLVGFFVWLPHLVFALPAGWLVDRVDRKLLMVIAEIGRGVAIATIVAALWMDALTLPHIAIVAFVEGTLYALSDLAEIPAVRNIVAPEQVPEALALNQGRAQGAVLAGRPLGGALFDVGRAVPFVVDVISYALATVALLFVRGPLQDVRDERRSPFARELLDGARWLWRQPFLRMIPSLSFGINFLFSGLVLLVIVAAREGGASGALVGALLALGGVGGIAGAVAAPRLQRAVAIKTIVVGAIWFWAILLLVLAAVSSPIALGLVFCAMAFAGPVWNVASGTYAVAVTPDALLGRMQGFARLVALGGMPLGSLVTGLLLDAIGPSRTALILAALMCAVALVATMSRAVRNAPEPA